MIWTLIKKEMLAQILSIRFYVSIALAFIFLIPATYILATDYGWLHREMGPFIKEGFYTWGGRWYWLSRDIPILRVLATGLDEELSLRSPNTVFNGPLFAENSNFVHNPLHYLLSNLDFVFFINIVGSLLAFAFTYDAISGERQRGALRLIFVNSIPRSLFLLSKWIGSYASFAITLVPALMGVIIVLYVHPDVDFRVSDWGATLFIFLLSFLYISAFFTLGLFVSCLTKNPKTTLIVLLTLWVVLVLVIPSFSPFLAAKLRPVRSIHQVEAQIASLWQDAHIRFVKEDEDFVQTHGRDWKTWSQSEKDTYNRMKNEQTRKRINLSVGEIARVRQTFINELQQQARVSQYLALISPSAGFVFLVSDIAHTGIESERDFRRAVIRYRSRYAEYVDKHIAKTGDYTRLERIDKNDVPPFKYKEITIPEAIAAYLPNFIVLLLYSALFFFGAQIIFTSSQL
jgi:ABC-type transport system involved in multi-copper enzyme maturation permease subunit